LTGSGEGAGGLTNMILSAVRHLAREGGPFALALKQPGDVRSAIAGALAAIDGDVGGVGAPGQDSSRQLEMLLRARLIEGLKHGDVPADLDIEDLAAFYTGVTVSLAVEALGDGAPRTLSSIRRIALAILPERAHGAP
jgi:hypothetical protein